MSQPYGRNDLGLPVQGIVHSSDASSGVEITLYDDDGSVRALATSEKLAVDSYQLTSAAGGDCRLFLDTNDDDAVDAGEEFARGDVAANGTISENFGENPFIGELGAKPHVIAPSGTVDVTFRGRILTPQPKTTAEKSHFVG